MGLLFQQTEFATASTSGGRTCPAAAMGANSLWCYPEIPSTMDYTCTCDVDQPRILDWTSVQMSYGSLGHVQNQDDWSRVCKCLTFRINGEASDSSSKVVGMLMGYLREPSSLRNDKLTRTNYSAAALHINLCRNYTAFAGHLSDQCFHHFLPLSASQKEIQKKNTTSPPLIYWPLQASICESHTITYRDPNTTNIKLLQMLLITLPRKSKLPHNEVHSVSPLFRFQAPGWNQACSLFSLSHSLSSLYVRTPGVGHHLTCIMFTVSL